MIKKDRVKSIVERLFYIAKGQVSPKDVAKLFIMSMSDGKMGIRASAITLNMFLAFFPLTIVLLTLTPFVPIDHFQERLFGVIMDVFSNDISDYLQDTINDIVNIPHSGLMSFGFFGAIIFSTNGVATLLIAFGASSHVQKRRKYLQQRLIALGITIVLIILVTLTVGIFVAGEHLIRQMSQSGVLEQTTGIFWIKVAKWFFTTLSVLLVFSILYGTATTQSRWHLFSQGSVFATIAVFLLTWLLKSYFVQFNRYNLLYGSIGSLIFMIMWIYFISYVILFGFEINMSIMRAKNEVNTSEEQLLLAKE